MNRLIPDLKTLAPADQTEYRRAMNRLYDLIGELEGKIRVVDSKPVQISVEQQQSIAQSAVGLIGGLAQPLAGQSTSDPLLASVAQAPGTGTVTSVALSAPSQFAVSGSPVTTSGTINITWNTQTANRILSGPSSGGAAAPTFRALVTADLPASAVQSTNSKVTAAAPYTNDGYIIVTINGVSIKLMTTA
jgi:hypothetical protein